MSQLDSLGQGPLIERVIFRFRPWILLAALLTTVWLAIQASAIRPDTQLEKMVPLQHEFLQNALQLQAGQAGEVNSVLRIAVAVEQGDIFTAEYMEALKQISDEVSLLDGVDTGGLRSLWTPALSWIAVTEEGFEGGPIIDTARYDGSRQALEDIREHLILAGMVGSYVANDFKASMIEMPVLAINPKTREPLEFTAFSAELEAIRDKYQGANIRLYMIGDVKKYADLVDGFIEIGQFFAIAFVITAVLLFGYSRCLRSTLAPLLCSSVAVIWQLGALSLLGYGVGVFSVLVPFLVFAIGISHGVQIINGVAHETAKGEGRVAASRITFRHLVKPGALALLSDGIGFATLLIIDIGVIQELALAASIGVAVIIVSNLVLLPVIMSYSGVSAGCVEHAQYKATEGSAIWDRLARLTARGPASTVVVVALLLIAVGGWFSQGLKIGDLDAGAPELRPDSRYNIDNGYITGHFSTSSDEMTLFVTTPRKQCESYKTVDLLNRLEWSLANTPGVQSVVSSASAAKLGRFVNNEGSLKFMALPRDERILQRSINGGGLIPQAVDEVCNLTTVEIALVDHKKETLDAVVGVIERFAAEHRDADIDFKLGSGNGAFEAATNQVIERAQYEMLAYVYGIVSLMCLLMFRSWRAVLCIIVPLAITSLLCQALMALLGIGVKVGTLPVIALGVGIGVDYGIYIYSRLESYLALGHGLKLAYMETLKTTGKAVCFTGFTLAIGVGTWAFSPIKFQANMGILLTFMFVWNMVGALCLLPALASFLLRQPVANETSVQARPDSLGAS